MPQTEARESPLPSERVSELSHGAQQPLKIWLLLLATPLTFERMTARTSLAEVSRISIITMERKKSTPQHNHVHTHIPLFLLLTISAWILTCANSRLSTIEVPSPCSSLPSAFSVQHFQLLLFASD